jgi:1A family penicillin-binding protein
MAKARDVPGGRRKPGTLARRLGLVFRISAYTLAGCLVAAYLLVYVSPLPDPPAVPPAGESTKVYDRNGRLLYDAATGGVSLHTHVPLTDLPLVLRQAVIATEDAGFYSHPGVDPVAIARAAFDNAGALEVRSGGSTLTQQLARNLYFDAGERASLSPVRKAREALLALRLERALSKDQILEAYLNRAPFGNLAYGIEAAARTYFGKSARDLDLAEASLLAGMLQGPSLYDPFTRLDAAKARQADVLRLMVEAGYIDAMTAGAAAAEPLVLNRTPFPIEAPHFVAWVLAQLPALAGAEAVAAGNLRVHTSLDLALQGVAEASLARQVRELADHNVGSGAVVAIDPNTGHVLAMAGSADYFDADNDGAVNSALAERQPGSAIKPVVYAAALEQGYSPASPLLDVPTSLTTRHGELYTPNNYDLTFHGVVPLREALASSYNVPAVRLLEVVGIDTAVRLGRDLGLTSMRDPADYDLSLTLGGGEVRLLDLTAAYGAFANGGVRVEPVAILRVETADGEVIFEAPAPTDARVLREETAYLVSDILSDTTARAPAFGLNSALEVSDHVAVKTGTTSDFRDNWTVGYSRDLVVGVWAGNPDGSPMRNVSGVDGAAPVWRDVMLAGLKQRPAQPFPEPAGIERVEVCLPSGLLATADCPRRRIELFAAGTAPSRTDVYYGRIGGGVYAFVPYEAIPWARSAGLDLPPVAPYTVAASGSAATVAPAGDGGLLRLISPPDGLVLSLSRDLPQTDQVLYVEALPSTVMRYVELSVNGRVEARREGGAYRFAWPLREGAFEIEARGLDLSGKELRSPVSWVHVLPP